MEEELTTKEFRVAGVCYGPYDTTFVEIVTALTARDAWTQVRDKKSPDWDSVRVSSVSMRCSHCENWTRMSPEEYIGSAWNTHQTLSGF